MITILIVIHVIICIGLIALVLIQRGRGGGLVESLSGVESVFGTKTSAFLTKSTTILSVMFFATCLSLAVFSVRQSKSLMRSIKPVTSTQEGENVKVELNQTAEEANVAAEATQTE